MQSHSTQSVPVAIQHNAARTDTDGQDISANRESIQTNAARIDAEGQDISINRESIQTNSARINTNGQAIQYNAARIDTNGQAISTNRESIQHNSARIDQNSARLNSAEKSIRHNADRIDENSKKIKQIGDNAAAMSSLHFDANHNSWALSTGTANGEGAGFAAGIQKGVTEHSAVSIQASTDSYGGWMAGAGVHGDF
ncbi:hypothetical protein BZ160_03810 [Pantoea vagans]|nr:hypothetical protein BZ160_03810 [Pantoea vagans]